MDPGEDEQRSNGRAQVFLPDLLELFMYQNILYTDADHVVQMRKGTIAVVNAQQNSTTDTHTEVPEPASLEPQAMPNAITTAPSTCDALILTDRTIHTK